MDGRPTCNLSCPRCCGRAVPDTAFTQEQLAEIRRVCLEIEDSHGASSGSWKHATAVHIISTALKLHSAGELFALDLAIRVIVAAWKQAYGGKTLYQILKETE